MSLQTDWNAGANPFTRDEVRFACAFGQSNVQEGVNTLFADLFAHAADLDLLYSSQQGVTQAGYSIVDWGDIRGGTSDHFGALVQFLRRRYDKGEINWCGYAHSRSGFGLNDHWLPGTNLEDYHIKNIKDQFGNLLGYADGHTNPINLDLLYYYQGETDMVAADDADAWKTNFRELISRFQESGLTWDKLVIVKVHSEYSARTGYTTVNTAIDELGQELQNTIVIDSESTQMDATDHHDSIGQMMMGERLSSAYDAALIAI